MYIAVLVSLIILLYIINVRYLLFLTYTVLIILLLLLLLINNITEAIFKVDFWKFVKNWSNLLLFVFIIIASLAYGLVNAPFIKYEGMNDTGYYVESYSSDFGVAYIHHELPIRIKTYGYFGSLIPQIILPYDAYGIALNNKLEILIKNSRTLNYKSIVFGASNLQVSDGYKILSDGFTAKVVEPGKFIILKYDKNVVDTDKYDTILLRGDELINYTLLNYSFSYTNS